MLVVGQTQIKETRMLVDAFTLGSVLFRIVAIVQQSKMSELKPTTIETVKTLCTRLNLDDISQTVIQMKSYDDFIKSSLIHKIESSLQKSFGIQTRTAFSLGNFLCISSLAPNEAMRETTLGHAEICARSFGLDKKYVTRLFEDIRMIPTNSIERHQKFLQYITSLHDELEKLERGGTKKKRLSPQIVAAIITALAAIIAALISVLLRK
jgi:hypothetical protein